MPLDAETVAVLTEQRHILRNEDVDLARNAFSHFDTNHSDRK